MSSKSRWPPLLLTALIVLLTIDGSTIGRFKIPLKKKNYAMQECLKVMKSGSLHDRRWKRPLDWINCFQSLLWKKDWLIWLLEPFSSLPCVPRLGCKIDPSGLSFKTSVPSPPSSSSSSPQHLATNHRNYQTRKRLPRGQIAWLTERCLLDFSGLADAGLCKSRRTECGRPPDSQVIALNTVDGLSSNIL